MKRTWHAFYRIEIRQQIKSDVGQSKPWPQLQMCGRIVSEVLARIKAALFFFFFNYKKIKINQIKSQMV